MLLYKDKTLTFRKQYVDAECGVVYYERWEDKYCMEHSLECVTSSQSISKSRVAPEAARGAHSIIRSVL